MDSSTDPVATAAATTASEGHGSFPGWWVVTGCFVVLAVSSALPGARDRPTRPGAVDVAALSRDLVFGATAGVCSMLGAGALALGGPATVDAESSAVRSDTAAVRSVGGSTGDGQAATRMS